MQSTWTATPFSACALVCVTIVFVVPGATVHAADGVVCICERVCAIAVSSAPSAAYSRLRAVSKALRSSVVEVIPRHHPRHHEARKHHEADDEEQRRTIFAATKEPPRGHGALTSMSSSRQDPLGAVTVIATFCTCVVDGHIGLFVRLASEAARHRGLTRLRVRHGEGCAGGATVAHGDLHVLRVVAKNRIGGCEIFVSRRSTRGGREHDEIARDDRAYEHDRDDDLKQGLAMFGVSSCHVSSTRMGSGAGSAAPEPEPSVLSSR